MPSLVDRLSKLARGPQGRRLADRAQRYAKSPEGRRQIEGLRRRFTKRK